MASATLLAFQGGELALDQEQHPIRRRTVIGPRRRLQATEHLFRDPQGEPLILRRIFAESGGALSMQRLHNLINPGIARNLHDQAWDVADKLVLAMRKGAR
jgi:hypothetical protein